MEADIIKVQGDSGGWSKTCVGFTQIVEFLGRIGNCSSYSPDRMVEHHKSSSTQPTSDHQ